jgi:hypothetical protein
MADSPENCPRRRALARTTALYDDENDFPANFWRKRNARILDHGRHGIHGTEFEEAADVRRFGFSVAPWMMFWIMIRSVSTLSVSSVFSVVIPRTAAGLNARRFDHGRHEIHGAEFEESAAV